MKHLTKILVVSTALLCTCMVQVGCKKSNDKFSGENFDLLRNYLISKAEKTSDENKNTIQMILTSLSKNEIKERKSQKGQVLIAPCVTKRNFLQTKNLSSFIIFEKVSNGDITASIVYTEPSNFNSNNFDNFFNYIDGQVSRFTGNLEYHNIYDFPLNGKVVKDGQTIKLFRSMTSTQLSNYLPSLPPPPNDGNQVCIDWYWTTYLVYDNGDVEVISETYLNTTCYSSGGGGGGSVGVDDGGDPENYYTSLVTTRGFIAGPTSTETVEDWYIAKAIGHEWDAYAVSKLKFKKNPSGTVKVEDFKNTAAACQQYSNLSVWTVSFTPDCDINAFNTTNGDDTYEALCETKITGSIRIKWFNTFGSPFTSFAEGAFKARIFGD